MSGSTTSRTWLTHGFRSAAVIVGVLALSHPLALPAAAEDDVAFVIEDPRIVQSSGLATDTAQRLYWTINDSDPAGIAYALDNRGRTVGTLRYRANPFDVEAIAYRDGRLYVGDTGGNRRPRTVVSVYSFVQPRPDDAEQDFEVREFAYPDGPHDTETLLAGPSGQLLLVTKSPDGGTVFVAPTGPSTDGRPGQLRPVGDAPPYVTDGTFLRDGRIVLRSYVGLYVLDPTTFRVLASAPTPNLPQGESVTLGLGGSSLLIGTEGERSKVLRVPVPTTLRPVPTLSPSPAPTRPPQPTATPTAPSDPSAGGLPTGALVGIGVAALVAVGIGVFVLAARRR